MHPLKKYLTEVSEPVADFAARVGASRQTLYRILNGRQAPKPPLARRIVEATGGAVTLETLFTGDAGGEDKIVPLPGASTASELDHNRLRLALAIVANHLLPQDNAGPPETLLDIAAEAACNTFIALAPVTTRQGPDRLRLALRPVLEEILRECADRPPSPGAMDRGAELATDIYYQTWRAEGPD